MGVRDKRFFDLASIIRKRRVELGYKSAEKFAYDNNLNRSVYQRWENAEDLNVTSLIKLLYTLKMSASTLFEKWEKVSDDMPQDIPSDELLLLAAERKASYKRIKPTKKVMKEVKKRRARRIRNHE
jgi:transcriptional regulator with XRE-family HTH domain